MRRYMQAGERIVGTRAIGNGGLEAPAAAVGGSGTEAIEGRGVTCVSSECCRVSMRRMLRRDSQSREGGRGGGSKCGGCRDGGPASSRKLHQPRQARSRLLAAYTFDNVSSFVCA